MSTLYNHPTRHYLQPVAGFDMMNHLNFVAPMSSEALAADNGSGTPAGMPAGSVMHLEVPQSGGPAVLKAGATGCQLPMFLLYNSWDPDATTGYMTADGTEITAIPAQSAGILNGNTENTSGYADSEAISRVGGSNLISPTWTGTGADGTVSYTQTSASGAHTVWPATCGMELSTTEWDLTKATSVSGSTVTPITSYFTPGTPLTSPAPNSSTSQTAGTAAYYQQKRGGYVTPVAAADRDDYDICGIVSRGVRENEHGVKVVYFHACFIPATPTTVGG